MNSIINCMIPSDIYYVADNRDKSENGLRWLRKKSEKCSEFNKRSEIYGGEQKGEQGGSERICGSKEGAEEGKEHRESKSSVLAIC